MGGGLQEDTTVADVHATLQPVGDVAARVRDGVILGEGQLGRNLDGETFMEFTSRELGCFTYLGFLSALNGRLR